MSSGINANNNSNVSEKENVNQENEFIYGGQITGWGDHDFFLKATKLIYNNQTNL